MRVGRASVAKLTQLPFSKSSILNWCTFYHVERNFKEAKRLKEERESLTQEGIKSQEKLESLQKGLLEDKKLLERTQQDSADLEVAINEKERLAGKFLIYFS